jgi:hypothetical protein
MHNIGRNERRFLYIIADSERGKFTWHVSAVVIVRNHRKWAAKRKEAVVNYPTSTYTIQLAAFHFFPAFLFTNKRSASPPFHSQEPIQFEYEKDYGTRTERVPVTHRVAEIQVTSILKLDRAEKEEEPAPAVDGSEFAGSEPTA